MSTVRGRTEVFTRCQLRQQVRHIHGTILLRLHWLLFPWYLSSNLKTYSVILILGSQNNN